MGKQHGSSSGIRDWQRQLAALSYDSGAASEAEAGEYLGLAASLLDSMPTVLVQASGRFTVPDIAPLLNAGAPTEAALLLLEGWAGYMLSCGPGGRPMATVAVERLGGEASADGESPALAIIGALAAVLAGEALDDDAGVEVEWRSTGVSLN